jgi:hypothetical protein
MVTVQGVVEAFFKAAQTTAKAVSGGGEDHAAASTAEEVEQVNEEVGDGFVFAGLAGEEEEVFTAVLVADAFEDGVEGLQLVGVEGTAEDDPRESIYIT